MGLWANQYLDFDLQGNTVVFFVFLGLALLIGRWIRCAVISVVIST